MKDNLLQKGKEIKKEFVDRELVFCTNLNVVSIILRGVGDHHKETFLYLLFLWNFDFDISVVVIISRRQRVNFSFVQYFKETFDKNYRKVQLEVQAGQKNRIN